MVVTENMGPISNLLCLAAYDPDAEQNSNITYSIISSTGPFSIDPAYGLLSVDKSLDYEHKQLHRLVVQAADNGVPSRKTRVTVEILVQDANDVPVFSQAHYTGNVLACGNQSYCYQEFMWGEGWGRGFSTKYYMGRLHPGWGGGTWVFFGWVCAARDSKLAPRSKKKFP